MQLIMKHLTILLTNNPYLISKATSCSTIGIHASRHIQINPTGIGRFTSYARTYNRSLEKSRLIDDGRLFHETAVVIGNGKVVSTNHQTSYYVIVQTIPGNNFCTIGYGIRCCSAGDRQAHAAGGITVTGANVAWCSHYSQSYGRLTNGYWA